MFSPYRPSKTDEEKAAIRRERANERRRLFFTNLDPIWYFSAGIVALAFAFKLFNDAAGDGPTNIIGTGILLLSLSCMFVGGFLYFNRGINESDETGFSSIKHKIIPVAILFIASLAFISGEVNTASNLGSGFGIFAQKSGNDLQFKSLTEGTGINLTESGTEIEIAATGLTEALPSRSFSITIEDPTNAEDISLWKTTNAITISEETCVVIGTTPSVTQTLRFGTDRSVTGTELNTGGNTITSTTTGDVDSTFDDATIPADNFIWVETTAQSGTVFSLNCSWEYTID